MAHCDTLRRLEALESDNDPALDALLAKQDAEERSKAAAEFSGHEREGLISLMFDDPKWAKQRLFGQVKPDFFIGPSRFIFEHSCNYFEKYGDAPTRETFPSYIEVVDPVLKWEEWLPVEALLKKESKVSEANYLKDHLQTWIRQQARNLVFGSTEFQDALIRGDRAAILEFVDKAETEHTGSRIETLGDLQDEFTDLNEPVIDGLLRRGETGNLISATKIGKSWTVYGLAFAVATGTPWLGRFACPQGKVLIIDNELHKKTLRARLDTVADALGISRKLCRDRIHILSLRGQGEDLLGIMAKIDAVKPQEYALVILDAWYRALPEGVDENSNAQITQLYNRIDRATAKLDAAWLNVHHSSKGNQSEKGVTDVGSGAGAQSRAPDCHLILRPHEQDGVFVLDAAVRSFPPVQPLSLHWQHPTWTPDDTLDATRLRGNAKDEQQRKNDKDGKAAIVTALQDAAEALPLRRLRATAGMGHERLERLVAQLVKDGIVAETKDDQGRATFGLV